MKLSKPTGYEPADYASAARAGHATRQTGGRFLRRAASVSTGGFSRFLDLCCGSPEQPKSGSDWPCGGAERWRWSQWLTESYHARSRGGTRRSPPAPPAPQASPFRPVVAVPRSECLVGLTTASGLAVPRRSKGSETAKAVGPNDEDDARRKFPVPQTLWPGRTIPPLAPGSRPVPPRRTSRRRRRRPARWRA